MNLVKWNEPQSTEVNEIWWTKEKEVNEIGSLAKYDFAYRFYALLGSLCGLGDFSYLLTNAGDVLLNQNRRDTLLKQRFGMRKELALFCVEDGKRPSASKCIDCSFLDG